jgi:hypothetical protein
MCVVLCNISTSQTCQNKNGQKNNFDRLIEVNYEKENFV